jgi:acyl-CoA synthetase (AMP-forming)/AMP-acid ligase II
MVPTQYIVTLAHPKFDDYDLNSLQVMLSAGSPLRLDTKKEILERFGPGLYELYGCSEGTATMLKPERMLDKFASVGTPVLGFDMRVVGDDDAELPWGETGEIVGYGGGLMKEYHKRPEETQAAIWRDPRGRSFVRTGDIGRFDEQGFLYIVDRKKDMIISGGFNVFPTDIEAVLGEHEDVLDVTRNPARPGDCGRRRQELGRGVDGLGQRAPCQAPAPFRSRVPRRVPPQRARQGAQARAPRRVRRGVVAGRSSMMLCR